MYKNRPNQRITLFVFDATTGRPVTGIPGALDFYVSVDGGPATHLTNDVVEDDPAHAAGLYSTALTQAETDGDDLRFTGVCGNNADTLVVPRFVYTGAYGGGGGGDGLNVVIEENRDSPASVVINETRQSEVNVVINEERC